MSSLRSIAGGRQWRVDRIVAVGFDVDVPIKRVCRGPFLSTREVRDCAPSRPRSLFATIERDARWQAGAAQLYNEVRLVCCFQKKTKTKTKTKTKRTTHTNNHSSEQLARVKRERGENVFEQRQRRCALCTCADRRARRQPRNVDRKPSTNKQQQNSRPSVRPHTYAAHELDAALRRSCARQVCYCRRRRRPVVPNRVHHAPTCELGIENKAFVLRAHDASNASKQANRALLCDEGAR